MFANLFSPYSELEWSSPISNEVAKQQLADTLVSMLLPGQVIGIGSGTTSFLALKKLAVVNSHEGWNVTVVPTSLEIDWYCRSSGLQVSDSKIIDVAFDGADEVDHVGNLIKGRGGALRRERENFDRADQCIVLADPTKYVERLGTKFAVPVEISQDYAFAASQRLCEMALTSKIRMAGAGKDGPVITEAGNVIFDVELQSDITAEDFDTAIRRIEGVVDNGLFLGYNVLVLK
jgi:ribose 5-phosphate isomerase A